MLREDAPVIVIGGGGAGIIAAWRAAHVGASVTLLERNAKLGIKLLISGGGKCNITHAGSIEKLRAAFTPHEARFLKPSFHRFTNNDIVRMIEEKGVSTYTRPNGRVFPLSGNARDVVAALTEHLKHTHVNILLNARAESVAHQTHRITGVTANGNLLPSSHVVIATGGASYPKTGTTGDGYRFAHSVGHAITPLRPALAPIGIKPSPPPAWRGIALRSGCLSLYAHTRKLAHWRDDMLFSHEGLTGPASLEISRAAAIAAERSPVSLVFDFFPSKDFAQLDGDLSTIILAHPRKTIASILEAWLPNRILPTLLQGIHVDPTKRGYVLTRLERRAITRMLKSWTIGEVAHIAVERGEVTAGGVPLDEVDPHTMRSRKVRGLYLCGEVLDIAGPIGGYNLQAAFSTGFLAGDSAGNDWLSDHSDPQPVELSPR